jgi:hypothetical protein
VPAGFRVVLGERGTLRLTRADGGVAVIARWAGGQDWEAAVRAEAARIAALPRGRFLGAIPLLCQLGRVRLTRGRYEQGGTLLEEMRIFAAHPKEPKSAIVLSYVYPAASAGEERLDQALAVLQAIRAPR